MSNKLIYRPEHAHQVIDQTRRQIRLISLARELHAHSNICCRTSVFDLNNAPNFKAISYEWGSAQPPRYIMVDDQLLAVSENLWHFLEIFRLQGGNKDWLWIDQISIDQSNQGERNHQVKMMGSIYSTASGVIAWLGTCNSDQTKLLEYVIYCLNNTLHPEDAVYESLGFLFQGNYWRRLWIVQELLLGGDVGFYIGTTLIHLRTLAELFRLFDEYNGDYDLKDHIRSLLRIYPADYPQSLAMVLSRVGTAGQCSEPRDRVYGLLGLADNSHSIRIDYSVSTEMLMKEVLETVIYGRIEGRSVGELLSLTTALGFLTLKLSMPEQWKVWLRGEPLRYSAALDMLHFINSPWAAKFNKFKWSIDQLMMIFREARAMFPPSKRSERDYMKRFRGTNDACLDDWIEVLNSLEPSLLYLQRFRTLDNSQGDLYRQSAAIPWDFGSRLEESDWDSIVESEESL